MKLYNTKSYFDQHVTCPSSFDRDIIFQFEEKIKDVTKEPMKAFTNINTVIKNHMGIDKAKELTFKEKKEAAIISRNALLYSILLMELVPPMSEEIMRIQMIALFFNEIYCALLDEIIKEDKVFVLSEMDKMITFQNSDDCTTPNILKENFLENIENKEILKLVKAKFVNVNFDDDLDEDVDFVQIDKFTTDYFTKQMKQQGMSDADIEKVLMKIEQTHVINKTKNKLS
jgi:hypothetical protein